MAKTIDLTDKLGIGERPAIVINGERYEVDDSAKSMLQLMSIIDGGEVNTSNVTRVYELLFDEKTRKRLDKLNLSFTGFMAVCKAAMELIGGGGDAEGEAETPATP